MSDKLDELNALIEKARGLLPRGGGAKRALMRNAGQRSKMSARQSRSFRLLAHSVQDGESLPGFRTPTEQRKELNRAADVYARRAARAGRIATYLGARRSRVSKAKPKTLYVYRPVENAEDIIAWAKGQGFGSTLAASDLHVTIAFSKTPLNWAKLGDDWCAEDPRPNDNPDAPRCAEACVSWSDGGRKQRKIEGGAREVKALGDKGAVVLAFQSPSLTERWAQFVRIGASWDYAGFTPHITISYQASGVDLAKVEPYKGPIILGEEDWSEIKEGAGENVPEVVTKADLDALNARLAAVEKAQQPKMEGA